MINIQGFGEFLQGMPNVSIRSKTEGSHHMITQDLYCVEVQVTDITILQATLDHLDIVFYRQSHLVDVEIWDIVGEWDAVEAACGILDIDFRGEVDKWN